MRFRKTSKGYIAQDNGRSYLDRRSLIPIEGVDYEVEEVCDKGKYRFVRIIAPADMDLRYDLHGAELSSPSDPRFVAEYVVESKILERVYPRPAGGLYRRWVITYKLKNSTFDGASERITKFFTEEVTDPTAVGEIIRRLIDEAHGHPEKVSPGVLHTIRAFEGEFVRSLLERLVEERRADLEGLKKEIEELVSVSLKVTQRSEELKVKLAFLEDLKSALFGSHGLYIENTLLYEADRYYFFRVKLSPEDLAVVSILGCGFNTRSFFGEEVEDYFWCDDLSNVEEVRSLVRERVKALEAGMKLYGYTCPIGLAQIEREIGEIGGEIRDIQESLKAFKDRVANRMRGILEIPLMAEALGVDPYGNVTPKLEDVAERITRLLS